MPSYIRYSATKNKVVTKNLRSEKSGDLLVIHPPQSKSLMRIIAGKSMFNSISTCFVFHPMSQSKNIGHSTFSTDDREHLEAPLKSRT